MKKLVRILGGALIASLLAVSAPVHAEEPTVEELLDATDDAFRGESSYARMEMYVKTARYERSMKMEAWSKGTEKTLIRILEPAKDAGVTTLKVEDNIWNYLPKVDRTMKVPAGMMSGSWMGSHFTNDDLVKETRLREDYTWEMTSRPDDNPGKLYQITLTPKPNAPVVWGKQVLDIRPDKVPVEARFYDEKGNLARTIQWSDTKEVDGRKIPTQMTLIPGDKPEELTRMRYLELNFGLDIPDSQFTLQALKK